MSHTSTMDKPARSVDMARHKCTTRRSEHRSPVVRMATLVMVAALVLLTAMLSGCIFLGNGSSGEGGGKSTTGSEPSGAGGGKSTTGSGKSTSTSSGPVGDPSSGECPLPDPDFWWHVPPELTADQQVRQVEVCQYIAGAYQARGYQIVATKQGPESGTIVDYMDGSNVPGANATPPDAPPPEAMVLPLGVLRQRMESEVYPVMQGPPNSIPVVRREFWDYVSGDSGATSLGEWFSNYQVIGNPSYDPVRKHAGFLFPGLPNQGANVIINSFGGSIERHTLSIHEMVVGCRQGAEMWQMIGIASSRDRLNQPERFPDFPLNKDNTLRLETEFLTDGPKKLGDGLGGWFSTKTGFVPLAGAPYAPGSAFAVATISTVDGPQFESLFQIRVWAGNWWIGHNGNWLGYYPGKLFPNTPISTFKTQACEVDYYGEVAAIINLIAANETWTFTPMGSGHFGEEGYLKASYFRNPTYVANDGGSAWTFPDPKNATLPPKGDYDPACYTSTPLSPGLPPSNLYFYLGGRGDAVGCH